MLEEIGVEKKKKHSIAPPEGEAAGKGWSGSKRFTVLPACARPSSYRKLNLWFNLKSEETSGILVFNHISDTESGA